MSTAYHEAGHVMMHFLFKKKFDYVYIHSTGGEVRGSQTGADFKFNKDELMSCLMILFAGRSAEEIYHNKDLSGCTSHYSDLQTARSIIKLIRQDPDYDFEESILCCSKLILKKAWPILSPIAIEIESKGFLTYNDILIKFPKLKYIVC
jgi:hypothetical protein